MEWFVLLTVAFVGLTLFGIGWFIWYVETTTPEQRAEHGVLLPMDRNRPYDTEEMVKEREFIRKTSQQ